MVSYSLLKGTEVAVSVSNDYEWMAATILGSVQVYILT